MNNHHNHSYEPGQELLFMNTMDSMIVLLIINWRKSMKYWLKSMMFLAIAMTSFLVGCNSVSMGSNETEFMKLLKDPSVKDINKSITIKREVDQGLTLSKDVLYFTIYNQTSNHLWFSADSNVQLFMYNEDEKKWVEIHNRITYSGEGRNIDPKGGAMDGNPTVVAPVYEKNGKEQQIRVAFTNTFANYGVGEG